MNDLSNRTRLYHWAQLVRLPNVFTVIADVAAAFLLVAHGPYPAGRFALIVLAGISLYWAGMILNDVFDIDRDRQERPSRPIPAGEISIAAATRTGWSLLVLGIAVALISGYLPGAPSSAMPGVVALMLATMIVAYDGPLKSTPLAPLAMGACRSLSFLLGSSAALSMFGEMTTPKYVMGIAVGFGIYITGITTMARHEAIGGRKRMLATGMFVTLIGLGLLAQSPRMFSAPRDWQVDIQRTFPLLIGLLGLPVMIRALRAVADSTPANIQTTIRVGILSIIPLAAAFAFLGAGTLGGIAVFALIVPAIVLASRLRVT